MEMTKQTAAAKRVRLPRPGRIVINAVLILCSLIWIYPIVWTIISSFKPQADFFKEQLTLFPATWTLDNYSRVWSKANFAVYFFNSVIVTVFSVLLVLIMTNMAGYVLGRYKFVGRSALMAIFLSSICIPLVSTLIPVYQIVKGMGLLGTRLGLILSGAGGAHVVFLLLFSSYYSTVPNELEEGGQDRRLRLPAHLRQGHDAPVLPHFHHRHHHGIPVDLERLPAAPDPYPEQPHGPHPGRRPVCLQGREHRGLDRHLRRRRDRHGAHHRRVHRVPEVLHQRHGRRGEGLIPHHNVLHTKCIT